MAEIPPSSTSGGYMYTDDGESRVKSHHVLLFVIIVGCLLLFHFRHKIAEAHDRYRTRTRSQNGFYNRLSSFQDDVLRGFSSSNFDLEGNIESNDPRKGLSEEAKLEIEVIMNAKGKSFDEARLEYTQSELGRNGIHNDGLPNDPKLVTF
ncbi:uncharacterized protein RJT20DRAFT_126525 [Scheffersomyces xylosifermentans]|uniref:uncharacterized protein n=1 Tax=Scheffersomyces xylosifermentans TaxID=1304137 RepID=UPI00315DC2DB